MPPSLKSLNDLHAIILQLLHRGGIKNISQAIPSQQYHSAAIYNPTPKLLICCEQAHRIQLPETKSLRPFTLSAQSALWFPCHSWHLNTIKGKRIYFSIACYRKFFRLHGRWHNGRNFENSPWIAIDVSDHQQEIHQLIKAFQKISRESKSQIPLANSILIRATELFETFLTDNQPLSENRSNSSAWQTWQLCCIAIDEQIHARGNTSKEKIAEIMKLHPSYITSLFQRFSGKSFITYVTEEKVRYAKYLLSHYPYTVAEVAHHCGFQDLRYFRRVFIKVEDKTPSTFKSHLSH